MELRTYEGTWEEVARHAAELAGHRVRLTVLDSAGPHSMLDETLAQLIREAEQLAALRGPDSSAAEAWGDLVTEKFRRQGLSL